MRHQKYKSEHTEMEYLNNTGILKVKNSLLEFEHYLWEWKDKEIKITLKNGRAISQTN